MGYFTEIFHWLIQDPMLHPGPGRTLLTERFEKASLTLFFIFLIIGSYFSHPGDEFLPGLFEAPLPQAINTARMPEEHTELKIVISINVAAIYSGTAREKMIIFRKS